MAVEMENYKSEVKRATITHCYLVILYLFWNSVTSLAWCHFWLQILTRENILAFQ